MSLKLAAALAAAAPFAAAAQNYVPEKRVPELVAAIGGEPAASTFSTMVKGKAAPGYNNGWLVVNDEGIYFFDRMFRQEKFFVPFSNVRRVEVDGNLRFDYVVVHLNGDTRYFGIVGRGSDEKAAVIADVIRELAER